MKCKACGHEQERGLFCERCGASLEASASADAPHSAPATAGRDVQPGAPVAADAGATHRMPADVGMGTQHNAPVARKRYKRNDTGIMIGAVLLAFIVPLIGEFAFASAWPQDGKLNVFKPTVQTTKVPTSSSVDEAAAQAKAKAAAEKAQQEAQQAAQQEAQQVVPGVEEKTLIANPDQREAAKAFVRFHQYITARNFTGAYALFSVGHQREVGSMSTWVDGYTTTKSSTVVSLTPVNSTGTTVVLRYKLKAVDFDGSGTKTQYFVGDVTMMRQNGGWVIDDMTGSLL